MTTQSRLVLVAAVLVLARSDYPLSMLSPLSAHFRPAVEGQNLSNSTLESSANVSASSLGPAELSGQGAFDDAHNTLAFADIIKIASFSWPILNMLLWVFGGACMILGGLFLAYTTLLVLPQAAVYSSTRKAVLAAITGTAGFYGSMIHYLVRGGSFPAPYFTNSAQAQVQLYGLALVARMWNVKHYRSGTFQNDMIKNLRNVAIPGTGLPLSVLMYSKLVAYSFLLAGYPLVCFISALHRGPATSAPKVCKAYTEQLLCPRDWFSFWQLNCRLATLHASQTGDKGYDMEDKWQFLQCAEELDIAVSPTIVHIPKIIVKHRNEEGGLGLHAFSNAAVNGGDWIIQEHLENDAFVASLLPDNAPLSTFRVVSQSRAGLPKEFNRATSTGQLERTSSVTPLSCVFRAGRQGAVTDHVSILYDVDMETGVIGKGTTNEHWYQLGLHKILTTPWSNNCSTTVHPDTGRTITGTAMGEARMTQMMDLARNAHAKMCPNVPLVGWDVAFTNKGPLLLEGNFSCNFFRGSFDQAGYFDFVHDYFRFLDSKKTGAGKLEGGCQCERLHANKN